MQVEYESSPAGPADDILVEEEGVSFRPGAGAGAGAGGDESDEGEEEEAVEQDKEEKPKKKISKQRQSLAEKQLGTTIFPLSRIKKIIKADKELENMSSEATFMIAVATEYFVKHFMEEGYTKARLEKRKIVNYKDLAAVVARSEEFDFLKDVIPTPISLSEALERRKQKVSTDENPSLHDSDPIQPISISLNDDDLPPLALSTNPLFPNAIMKKPPNTHAKSAQQKPPSNSNSNPNMNEPDSPIAPTTTVPPISTSSSSKGRVSGSGSGQTPQSATKVLSGKNAPSTPHGLTTRGAARRSLVGTDVDMSPLNDLRREVAVEVEVEHEDGDERMEE
ncbi:uncharacterized protein IL334_007022 [Kwoniella shivajii]|uniref:Transcription factor CBF/NF-Y/archaeal histone domain-containing protein n=1 Tax=Kwoniella shivajii TaxID=564305 RepID=A0ABZ1D7J2_9TREE|nr:hypothetical protein IL334_007022 [Kwoniella shivajii]